MREIVFGLLGIAVGLFIRFCIIEQFKNKKWQVLTYKTLDNLTENYTTETTEIELVNEKFSKFDKLKVVLHNQENLPIWQKRKNKKPMVMIDEIQLYNN